MFHMLAVGLERKGKGAVPPCWVWWPIQLSLSTTATLGTEESGRCREVAAVERFKQESMYNLSAKKSGCCREMAVVERWPLVEVRL